MNIFKNKTVLIVIIIFIISFVAYALFVSSSKKKPASGVTKQAVSTNTVTTGGGSTAQTALDGPGKEFVAQLLAIQNINFSLDFFSDPVFMGLRVSTREIQPQEAGRPNPFAPLGDDSRVGSPSNPDQAVSNLNAPAPTTKPSTRNTKIKR
jgi:hypothetical protein